MTRSTRRPDILPPLSGMFSELQITFWTWLGWLMVNFRRSKMLCRELFGSIQA